MPPTELSIFGLTFHLYGLIVGLSLLLGVTLAEKILDWSGYTNTDFWKLSITALVGGLIGARLWHVMTDWQLYTDNWVASLYVWNGGLSILGAVVGGLVAVTIYDRWRVRRVNIKAVQSIKSSGSIKSNLPLLVFLDAAAIALPFAHAVGRLANWVNQELFGPPTNLPWGIPIQVEFRPVDYMTFTHFHPLFLYEMFLNLLIGGFLLAIYFKSYRSKSIEKSKSSLFQKFKLGSGNYLLTYLLMYSAVRFGLDFMRIEKSVIFGGLLGFNQLILLGVMIASLVLLKRNLPKS